MKSKKVVVIGAGPAGMETSANLAQLGFDVQLIEKEKNPGGKLNSWDRLFPTLRNGEEVLKKLEDGIHNNKIELKTETKIRSTEYKDGIHFLTTDKGETLEAGAVIVTTGFEVFDARKKEEYGYGIYENVITSKDLEAYFRENKKLCRHDGKPIKKVGIVHCVGSRDEKAGNIYCSKVCCVTGVKQAIEIHQQLPESEITCFYMDLRMFGMHFEELYKQAQEEHGVQFIRGRLSEASENADGTVIVKVEDTLTGKPLKMSVDLLVLLVGFVPGEGTKKMGELFNLSFNDNGFLKCDDEHLGTAFSSKEGVFLAGTCSAPRTITNTVLDARSTALKVSSYLKDKE